MYEIVVDLTKSLAKEGWFRGFGAESIHSFLVTYQKENDQAIPLSLVGTSVVLKELWRMGLIHRYHGDSYIAADPQDVVKFKRQKREKKIQGITREDNTRPHIFIREPIRTVKLDKDK